MKQLSEKELQSKIDSFMSNRLRAHPELASVQLVARQQNVHEGFVSRVKNISKKLNTSRVISSQSQYQL